MIDSYIPKFVISTGGPAKPVRNGEISSRPKSAHRPRPNVTTRAFTLIELLVVISVIALLMALMIPALSRARKQARAVVCQVNSKQWGTFMMASVTDNDGSFRSSDWGVARAVYGPVAYTRPRWGLWNLSGRETGEGIVCCPMASKYLVSDGNGLWNGGTFVAWTGGRTDTPWTPYGCDVFYSSYGLSTHVGWNWILDVEESKEKRIWRMADVRGQRRIPVLLDSASYYGESYWDDAGPSPPQCDAIPTLHVRAPESRNTVCINRHSGAVNALFMDWSVRKVGLKELWTLKWHRQYNTAGPWTLAGGVQPTDWPEWMRKFKDY